MRSTILVTAGALILVGSVYYANTHQTPRRAGLSAEAVHHVVDAAVLYGWHCRDAGQTLEACKLHEVPRILSDTDGFRCPTGALLAPGIDPRGVVGCLK